MIKTALIICLPSSCPTYIVCFSTSWLQDGFPTRSGTVCSTSWPRWWEETRRSSATLRRDASLPNSSPLSTCGKETFCSMMTDLLKWKICLLFCPLVDKQLNCLLLFLTLCLFHLFSSLTKDESKRPKYKELLVSSHWPLCRLFFILTLRFFEFVLTHKSSFTTPERSVHPDVRGALGGRRRLCLQAPGSDASVSQLTDVHGLIAEQHSKCINK